MNNMFLFAALLHLKETKNPPIYQAANRGTKTMDYMMVLTSQFHVYR